MKLIYCTDCNSVLNLNVELKTCPCGKSGGRYLNRIDAEYFGKDAIPLGFNNFSLAAAITGQPKSGRGKIFEAFVISKKCPTLKKKRNPKMTTLKNKNSDGKIPNGTIVLLTEVKSHHGKTCLEEFGNLARLVDLKDGEYRLVSPSVSDPFASGYWSYWIPKRNVTLTVHKTILNDNTPMDFERLWEHNQGAIFLKNENSGLEWKREIAQYFFRHGGMHGAHLAKSKQAEIAKKFDFTDSFKGTDFGHKDYTKIVFTGLMKVVRGYANGNTLEHILEGLGYIVVDRIARTAKVTDAGKDAMYELTKLYVDLRD